MIPRPHSIGGRLAVLACFLASGAFPATAHELPGRLELYTANAAIGATVVVLTGLFEGRPWDQIARGAGWGALGGTLGSWGKDRAFHLRQDPLAGLEAKILASLATSLIEDTAAGRRPGTTVSTDVGPVFLTWQRGAGWAPTWRLLPVATASLVMELADGVDGVDVLGSLQTLTPVFLNRRRFPESGGGSATANTITLGASRGHALSQELMHTLQYRQLFVLQVPAWDDTLRESWWKLDVGGLAAMGAERLITGRRPSDRESFAETEADALEELHPRH